MSIQNRALKEITQKPRGENQLSGDVNYQMSWKNQRAQDSQNQPMQFTQMRKLKISESKHMLDVLTYI